MVGILVTGHGKFVSGIMDVVRLVAGEQTCCEAVEFAPADSIEQLSEKLREAWDRLEESCAGVAVFADLPGGSPFNAAVREKFRRGKPCEVIGGCNVPMILTAVMSHEETDDPGALAGEALDAGKEQMFLFAPPDADADGCETDED